MKTYKKMSDMNVMEQREEKWNRNGQPYMVWPSAEWGPYVNTEKNRKKMLKHPKDVSDNE